MTYSISGDKISRSELFEVMNDYHLFLHQNVVIDKPIWSEAYKDAFGAGLITTLSYPIFV